MPGMTDRARQSHQARRAEGSGTSAGRSTVVVSAIRRPSAADAEQAGHRFEYVQREVAAGARRPLTVGPDQVDQTDAPGASA